MKIGLMEHHWARQPDLVVADLHSTACHAAVRGAPLVLFSATGIATLPDGWEAAADAAATLVLNSPPSLIEVSSELSSQDGHIDRALKIPLFQAEEGPKGELRSEVRSWLKHQKRKIVYVAFGSISVPKKGMMAKLAQALEGETVLHAAVNGREDDPEPENWKRVDWVNQRALLNSKRVKLFVSHCGINSVWEAALAGVPFVCVPLQFDQPEHAAELASGGFAKTLHPEGDLVQELTAVLRGVGKAKLASAALGEELREYGGAERFVEDVLGPLLNSGDLVGSQTGWIVLSFVLFCSALVGYLVFSKNGTAALSGPNEVHKIA